MSRLLIRGPTRLEGRISISGAKNAALPLMAAAAMAHEEMVLDNLPQLTDTDSMLELLAHLRVKSSREGESVRFSPLDMSASKNEVPKSFGRKTRASVLLLAPLLVRHGEAVVSLPGGDAIGVRPVDLHIDALEALGAKAVVEDGYIKAEAKSGLVGGEIRFPFVSVGATENALMAGAVAQGKTRIIGAAIEPEIVDLAECLIAMGARIEGHGSSEILIDGVENLGGCRYKIIPDRIEAGTFAIAAAMTGGEVLLEDCLPAHLPALWAVLREAGVSLEENEASIAVKAKNSLKSVSIATGAYPQFATDLQAQLMAMMCLADGVSTITETIFENRFRHVSELVKLGADIAIKGNEAIIQGGSKLRGAEVMATDIRASVSLVLAGLVAEGETVISGVDHLDRGYCRLEEKLGACGADIIRLPSDTKSKE